MKNLSKKTWFKYIVTPIGILLFLSLVFLTQTFVVNEETPIGTDLRAYSTLYYCSTELDENCQVNDRVITKLDIRFRTPNTDDKGINFLLMDVLLDEIKIGYYEDSPEASDKATEEFPGDFTLYLDANDNNVFDDKDGGDTKIATSNVKGNEIILDKIDFTLSLKWAKYTSLDTTYTFFLVGENSYDTFNHTKLDDLDVRIYDSREEIVKENRVYSSTSAVDKSMWTYDHMINMSRDEYLEINQLFVADETSANGIILKKGDYEIKYTKVIPTDLQVTIEAGVNIKMGPDASLVSYSPVVINGTKNERVTFTRLTSKPWGAFGVIGNQGDFGEVMIQYADFEGGYETEINGAYLSGMVSLYRATKTTITNSTFENAHADDALNVKYSEVDISNSTFNNNSADAFDGDFVSGIVMNNIFNNNGNDSIDTSGSTIKIYNNYIYNSGDKCMSFGEGSDTIAVNNLLYGCNIGIEVKDDSHPIIANNLFLENNVGYNSYLKKYFYDSPSATLLNNLFIKNKQQITFNNSFTGVIRDTDLTTVTMKSNLFDDTYTLDDTRNLCVDCNDNIIRSDIGIDRNFMLALDTGMTSNITDANLYARYNISDVKIGLIKSFWKK